MEWWWWGRRCPSFLYYSLERVELSAESKTDAATWTSSRLADKCFGRRQAQARAFSVHFNMHSLRLACSLGLITLATAKRSPLPPPPPIENTSIPSYLLHLFSAVIGAALALLAVLPREEKTQAEPETALETQQQQQAIKKNRRGANRYRRHH